jgi:CheY-like chemotaxis protein
VHFNLKSDSQKLTLELQSTSDKPVVILLEQVPQDLSSMLKGLEFHDFYGQLLLDLETQRAAFAFMRSTKSALAELSHQIVSLSNALVHRFGGAPADVHLQHENGRASIEYFCTTAAQRFSFLFASSFYHSLKWKKRKRKRFSQLLDLARLYFLGDYSLDAKLAGEREDPYLPESLNSFVNFLHAESWQVKHLLTKLLLVENNAQLAEIYSDMLSSYGYVVSVAGDGLQALDRCDQEHYDLILSDIQMPKLNGLGLVKVLRELGETTPIILLTGYASLWKEKEVLQQGATDFLEKPIDLENLLQCVCNNLLLSNTNKEI